MQLIFCYNPRSRPGFRCNLCAYFTQLRTVALCKDSLQKVHFSIPLTQARKQTWLPKIVCFIYILDYGKNPKEKPLNVIIISVSIWREDLAM